MKKFAVLASILALALVASAQSNLSLPAGTAVKMKLPELSIRVVSELARSRPIN